MSIISEYVTPFFKWYDRLIDGEYIATQLQFKGSNGEAGGDYTSKIDRSHRRTIQAKYDDTLQSIKHPTFPGFLQDNLFRLLLNPFDRLVTAYQAYPSMKTRFMKPGTYSHTFTQIMNEGLIFGAFKGVIYNFAQFAFVLYPSVYFANKNGSDYKFLTFLSSYTFLDALFYPVDTLKNILYADTLGTYTLKSATTSIHLIDLYKGLPFKLAYNIPVLSGMYCTTQEGWEVQALLAWAAALALYPINTQKVRAQVSASILSTINSKTSSVIQSGYHGALTYIALNALIGYSLRPLFSQEKLCSISGEVKASLKEQGLD